MMASLCVSARLHTGSASDSLPRLLCDIRTHLRALNPHNNDPKELAPALKILLRGWRKTLVTLVLNHVPDATISDKERQPPYRVLAKCRSELADLPALESFTTQNMYFDDEILQNVCCNPQLRHVTVTNAKISPQGFRRMVPCRTLESVCVSRCPEIGQADKEFLLARLPKVRYVT